MMAKDSKVAADLRAAIDNARRVLRERTVFDERIGDDDDVTIGQVCEPDEALYDVHYSHDVFLFWDAMAKLAKCRYVVRNRRGIIIDTNMLCDGDVIVFDRKRYEQMGGDR